MEADGMSPPAAWFTAVALFSILAALVLGKIPRGKINSDRAPPPPVVNGIALLPALLTKGLKATLHDLYAKCGSVFTVSLFVGPKLTFLVGPDVSAHFFTKPESVISRADLFEFLVPMFGQEVGYGVDADTRNEQARFFVDALKPSRLKSYVDPMLQEVEAYFANWGQDGTVDLKQEFEQIFMLTASRCLLGKEVREKMFDEVYKLFHEIENGWNFVSVLYPYIPIPANWRRDKARVKLTKILSEVVRSRKSSGRVEEDMLQRLIDSKYKDNRSTTEAEVTGMIISLLFAGKHTSSHASTWTGACLLSNARCLTAVVDEQKQIIKKYKNQIDQNVLLQMDVMHCCIKEALRMHPSSPVLIRKALESFTVSTTEGNGRYDIPKGHTVVSPIILNHNLPYVYKDPHVFDPDRFGPGREEDRIGGRFSYTSFSGGRSACVGEAFAYMQMKVVWSHLLRNFDLELMSPLPDTDWSKLVLEPPGKVMVSYKRRSFAPSV